MIKKEIIRNKAFAFRYKYIGRKKLKHSDFKSKKYQILNVNSEQYKQMRDIQNKTKGTDYINQEFQSFQNIDLSFLFGKKEKGSQCSFILKF